MVNQAVDPTFGFMTVDWDGKIRMDPSSPLRHGRADRAARPLRRGLRQRRRRRPARHRHRRGAGCSIPTTTWPRRSPTCSAAGATGRAGRGGQDDGLELDDRPGRRRPGPAAGRGPGRVQVVRGRAAGRLARLRRRGERRRLVPAPRRDRLDHRQGRHRLLPAGRRDDRAAGRDPGEQYRELTARFGDPVYRRRRRRGHPRAEGRAQAAVRRATCRPRSWPASRSPTC